MPEYPTADEMAAVAAVLDRLAEGRAQRPSLTGLIEGWRHMVESVEAGYDWSVYEYFNDLHVRRLLEVVMTEAPAISGWVRAEVEPLDERFRAATRSAGSEEFLKRVPIHPGPELAGDLDDPEATTTLYRPVGDAERIAREWNVPEGGAGHVTRFAVRTSFLLRYPAHAAGGDNLRELWVPAEDLEGFCDHLVGPIEVVATFGPEGV